MMPPRMDKQGFAKLLYRHRLPVIEAAGYDAASWTPSSTDTRTAAKQAINGDLTFEAGDYEDNNELQAAMKWYVATLGNDPASLDGLESVLIDLTKAGFEEAKHGLSGEVGLSFLQKSILIDPLNKMMGLIDLPLGHTLYWRFIGVGESGKPYTELVYSTPATGGSDRVERKLAIVTLKTIKSLHVDTPQQIYDSAGNSTMTIQQVGGGYPVMREARVDLFDDYLGPASKVTTQVSFQPLRR